MEDSNRESRFNFFERFQIRAARFVVGIFLPDSPLRFAESRESANLKIRKTFVRSHKYLFIFNGSLIKTINQTVEAG